MSSDTAKRNPGAKDMKSVISQFEQKGKDNYSSESVVPKPAAAGFKPARTATTTGQPHKAFPAKQESGSSLVTSTTLGKLQGSQPEEATNQFKVTLKPVKPSTVKPPSEAEKTAKPSNASKPDVRVNSESSVSSRSKMFEKPAKDGADPDAPASHSESLVGNRSKKFETIPRQPASGSSSNTSSSMKEKASEKSIVSKASATSKSVSKGSFVAGMTQGSSNSGTSAADKRLKDSTDSDEKGLVQKQRSDGSQEAVKFKIKAFANEQENKTSIQRPAYTKDVAGKSGPLSKKTAESSEQASNKAESNEELCEYANEYPKPPSKPKENYDKTKHPVKMPSAAAAEEANQPKIPSRKTEKAQETKTVEKMPSSFKKSTSINQQNNETKPAKIQGKFNQSANKNYKTGTDSSQSLLRNKARPVPPPTGQKDQAKYRLLPVPKPSGNAPRKLAKPPAIDLGKFLTYAKSKGLPVHQPQNQSSVGSFEDGDDLYDDCENVSTRISEYTEEEEANLEKMAKLEKVGHKISHDEYADDDEIYQEID